MTLSSIIRILAGQGPVAVRGARLKSPSRCIQLHANPKQWHSALCRVVAELLRHHITRTEQPQGQMIKPVLMETLNVDSKFPACSDPGSTEPLLSPSDIELPRCKFGVGTIIRSPQDGQLVQGAQADLVPVWPDDRGHFLEVHRVGAGLSRQFPHVTTQVSATVTYPELSRHFTTTFGSTTAGQS